MKVRRRTSAAFDARRLVAWFRPRAWLAALRRLAHADHWLERVDAVSVADPPATAPPRSAPPAGGPPSPGDSGEPRPDSPLQRWREIVRERPTPWILGGTFAGTAVAGYLFAALVMFPAPFITSTVTVPRLVGLSEDDATELLRERGLPVGEVNHEVHDHAPAGQVIWQEPPAETRVSELTNVQLTVSNGPRRIPVPDVSGFESDLARRLIEATGLNVGRVEAVQTAVPRDVVVNTRPAPGSTMLPGAGVTLVVSVGAPTISVPDLTGLTPDEARDSLAALGLELGETMRRTTSLYPAGTIIDQRPAAGTLLAPGTTIEAWVARSPQ